MKYNAVIFDMDGTIIDTEQIWVRATRTVIERRGIIITPALQAELLDQMPGNGILQCSKIIKDMLNLEDDVYALAQEKSDLAFDLINKHAQFIDGFEEFHAKVRALNLKVALATNADDANLQVIEKKLNLKRFFGSHIYTISHVKKGKPDPELYELAALQLGENPAHCIAIEDSATGIQAARGAGTFCIGFDAASRPDQVKDADMIVHSYHEIDLNTLLQVNKDFSLPFTQSNKVQSKG
jgi:beta-phosphoglucomutase